MENTTPVLELELFLIRHGQSCGNAGYDKEDLTLKEMNDPILTAKGFDQADRLGRYLSEIDFDAVYSSALLRAVLTSNGIMKYQKTKKEINLMPILCEVSINPEYHGVGLDELKEIYPLTRMAPDLAPDSPMVYHNEFHDEEGMFERAETAIEYLKAHHSSGEKVAVVAHAAFLTFFVFSLMGYKKSCPIFDIDFENTNVTRVCIYKHGTNKYGDIIFKTINDTTHLKDGKF